MGKKCMICGEEARFAIKDSSDYYCDECAKENFSDISVLVDIEEPAARGKQIIDKKININEE